MREGGATSDEACHPDVKMNLPVMLFVLVCAAVVQAVVPSLPALGEAPLPVLLSVVMYYGLARDLRLMILAGILGGFLQDGLSLIPLGYSSFVYCVTGWVMSRFKDMVFVHETVTHMLFGALGAAGATLILYVLISTTSLQAYPLSMALHKAGGAFILGALVAPVVFRVSKRFDQWMGNVGEKETSWSSLP